MPGAGSSTTSSPTSGSSCTSDGLGPASVAPGIRTRLAGLIRLGHPFPSLLNAAATGVIAYLAGGAGEPAVGPALRLAAGMLAIQLSIGAVNDLADADLDRGRKPGKPLPRGAVEPPVALGLAAGGLAVGLGLAAVSGAAVAAVAASGAGLGYLYDLRLSRTPWSWLPLALALPLLPIYAWLGATGGVPASLWLLLPIAAVAGLGLALANGLADFDRDAAAGVATAALRLGRTTAWRVHALAIATVVIAAIALAPRATGGGGVELLGSILGLKGGSLIALAGALLLAPAGLRHAGLRERAWELEAIGVAAIGLAWLGGIANP